MWKIFHNFQWFDVRTRICAVFVRIWVHFKWSNKHIGSLVLPRSFVVVAQLLEGLLQLLMMTLFCFFVVVVRFSFFFFAFNFIFSAHIFLIRIFPLWIFNVMCERTGEKERERDACNFMWNELKSRHHLTKQDSEAKYAPHFAILHPYTHKWNI